MEIQESPSEQNDIVLAEDAWMNAIADTTEAKDILDRWTDRIADEAERDPDGIVAVLFRSLANLSRLVDGAKMDLDILGQMLGYDGNGN